MEYRFCFIINTPRGWNHLSQFHQYSSTPSKTPIHFLPNYPKNSQWNEPQILFSSRYILPISYFSLDCTHHDPVVSQNSKVIDHKLWAMGHRRRMWSRVSYARLHEQHQFTIIFSLLINLLIVKMLACAASQAKNAILGGAFTLQMYPNGKLGLFLGQEFIIHPYGTILVGPGSH